MKKKIIVRIVLIILIIVNCTVIFKFSSEISDKSNQTSGRVIEEIVEINPFTKNLEGKEKEDLKEKIVAPVRKTAHFTVYCSLGLLLFVFFKTIDINDKKRIMISLFLAFLYACTDEIHQLFVSGRSGEFKDVCIDTCGALFGILVVYFVYKLKKRKKYL